jgi:hypothetical protein
VSAFGEFIFGSPDFFENGIANFRGVEMQGITALQWQSENLQGIEGYIVLRNGVPIMDFHQTPSLRSASATAAYQITDNTVQRGKEYQYRIRDDGLLKTRDSKNQSLA